MKKYTLYIIIALLIVGVVQGALIDNIYAYYKFDGDDKDSTGIYNATNNGALVDTSVYKLGNASYNFTPNDFVITPSFAGLNTSSVNVWVKSDININLGSSCKELMRVSTNANSIFLGELCFGDPANSRIFMQNGAGSSIIGWNDDLDTNWHMLSFVNNATGWVLFIDGVNKGNPDYTSATFDTTWDLNGQLKIGGNGLYFDGHIDEVSFWERILTDGEISDLYNNATGLQYPFTNTSFITGIPVVNIEDPLNDTYISFHSNLNYSAVNSSLCWYSLNEGITNSSQSSPGVNFSGLISNLGSNTWTVYCKNSVGNVSSDSVSFTIDLNLITGNYLYYGFNGNTNDELGNYDATNNGAIEDFVTYKLPNGSYEFIPNDYITTPSLSGLNVSSINVWLKSDNNITAGSSCWELIRATSNANTLFLGDSCLGLTNTVSIQDSGGSNSLTWNEPFDTGWHMITIVNNGSSNEWILYLDGVNKGYPDTVNGNFPQTWDFASAMQIGGVTGGFFFDGHIDEFALWERRLYDFDVTNLYNSGIGKAYPYNSTATPIINIVYPTNLTYPYYVTELNYSVINSDSQCWYSNDNGATNSSGVIPGVNFTSLTSNLGSNTWTVYCNNTNGNLGSDSTAFTVDLALPTKIVKQVVQDNITFYTNGFGSWVTPDLFFDNNFTTQAYPSNDNCPNVTKTYYKSSANGTEVNTLTFETKVGNPTTSTNYTIDSTTNPGCFNNNITFRWWCPTTNNIQFECLNSTGLPTVLETPYIANEWMYETVMYWNVTINQSIQVDFYDLPPENASSINKPTPLQFNLLAYEKNANCTVFVNNTFYTEFVNISEGTYPFIFNSSSWTNGYNLIDVTCKNETYSASSTKYIFVDDISPEYLDFKPANETIISKATNFTINITTNDTNNWGLNVSIIRSGYGTEIFSDVNTNVTKPIYNYLNVFNFYDNATGWYKLTATGYDAHTRNRIPKNKLIKRLHSTNRYLGYDFDERVKVYFKKSQINRFYTVRSIDRDKFDVKFKPNKQSIDIFIEAEDIEYVGNRYGYVAHFILDNEYWLDFNNNASMTVEGVTKISNNIYKVTMNKDPNVRFVMFYSIGVLNSNTQTNYLYNNNVNENVDSTVTTFNGASSVALSLTPNVYEQTFVKIFRKSQPNETFMSFNVGNNSLQNFTMYFGDTIGTPSYSVAGSLNGLVTSWSMHESLYGVYQNCTCADCSITPDDECLVPVNVKASTGGNIELRNFYTGLELETGVVHINIVDANTLLPVTQTNMTVQLIGDEYQGEVTTINSNATIFFNFNESVLLNLTARCFQTETPRDYSIVIRNLELTQGEETNLIFYVSNTSDSNLAKYVTFRVIDEFASRVENAIVQVYKQNPLTNQFLLITELTTNPNGEASTILFIDDVFYKFFVEYDGKTVFSSIEEVSIAPTDDIIRLSATLGIQYLNFYDKISYDNIKNYQLGFVDLSNTSGYFTASVISESSIETCLRTWMYNDTVPLFIEEFCNNGTSSSLQSSTYTSSETKTYLAWLYIDYFDGQGKIASRNLLKTIGLSILPEKQTALLFVYFMVIVFCAFGFYYNKHVGLLVFAGLNLVLMMTKLFPFPSEIGALVISLTIISLITISRTKTNV